MSRIPDFHEKIQTILLADFQNHPELRKGAKKWLNLHGHGHGMNTNMDMGH
jgi:hypothetical protein